LQATTASRATNAQQNRRAIMGITATNAGA
jgi:hypothetical protein